MRVVVGIVALLVAAPALAQTPPPEPAAADVQRARALFEQGQALYEQARYEEALASFSEAYRLSSKPLLLWNKASCLERLGRWSEAVDALEAYRVVAPSYEQATLQRRLELLYQRIEEASAAAVPPQPLMELDDPEPTRTRGAGPPPGAWALFGVGAVGVGSGTAFTLRALSARGEWKATCTELEGARLCPASTEDLIRRDRTSSVIADLSWVVALGAVGGGVYLTVAGDRDGGPAVTVSGMPGGLVVQGAF